MSGDSRRWALVQFVAAVKDMVKLGDWVAAFDADWHAMWIITSFDVFI